MKSSEGVGAVAQILGSPGLPGSYLKSLNAERT